MFGIGLPELAILFSVVLLVKTVSTLVDVLKSEFTGSNKIIWFLVVLFLPLFGIIAYHFIGSKQKITDKQSTFSEKNCPYCAEVIKAEAKICRFCGKELPKLANETI